MHPQGCLKVEITARKGRLNDAMPPDQALTTTGSLRKSSIRDLKEP
jgi:hypothetical protein